MARLVHDDDRDIDFGNVISAVYEGDGWHLTVECDRHMMTVSGSDASGYFGISGYSVADGTCFVCLRPQGGGNTVTVATAERFKRALDENVAMLTVIETFLRDAIVPMSERRMPKMPAVIESDGSHANEHERTDAQ